MFNQLIGLLVVAVTWLPHVAEHQKPVQQVPSMADHFNAPRTLAQLFDAADVVIIARVKSRKDISTKQRARTVYEMEAVNEMKARVPVGAIFNVYRPIGEYEYPDKIHKTFQQNLNDFQIGQKCLLFLTYHQSTDSFWLAFGDRGAAVFDASDKLLTPEKHITAPLMGRTESEVSQALNALKKR